MCLQTWVIKASLNLFRRSLFLSYTVPQANAYSIISCSFCFTIPHVLTEDKVPESDNCVAKHFALFTVNHELILIGCFQIKKPPNWRHCSSPGQWFFFVTLFLLPLPAVQYGYSQQALPRMHFMASCSYCYKQLILQIVSKFAVCHGVSD